MLRLIGSENYPLLQDGPMHEHVCCFLFRFVKYAIDVLVKCNDIVRHQSTEKKKIGHVSVPVCLTGNCVCFCHIILYNVTHNYLPILRVLLRL
jgi:hypothetical protein